MPKILPNAVLRLQIIDYAPVHALALRCIREPLVASQE